MIGRLVALNNVEPCAIQGFIFRTGVVPPRPSLTTASSHIMAPRQRPRASIAAAAAVVVAAVGCIAGEAAPPLPPPPSSVVPFVLRTQRSTTAAAVATIAHVDEGGRDKSAADVAEGALFCSFHRLAAAVGGDGGDGGTQPGTGSGGGGSAGGGKSTGGMAVTPSPLPLAERAAARADLARVLTEMAGTCMQTTVPVGGYKYTACLGDAVRQSGDGGDFVLGRFKPPTGGSWELVAAGVEDMTVLAFDGGDACPNSVRAGKLTLMCGAVSSVVSATEPATCRYDLAATHPALCALPPWLVRRAPSAEAAEAHNSLVEALPPRLRSGLQALLGDGAADGTASADVPGVGGRTIGIDDRYRTAHRWQGLGAAADGSRDAAPTWALEAHHTVAGVGGLATGRQFATVACAAFSTDDLRKSGGAVGSGRGDTPTDAAAGAADLGPFALVLWADASRGVRSSEATLVHATARGANRRTTPIAADMPLVPLTGPECERAVTAGTLTPPAPGAVCLGGVAAAAALTPATPPSPPDLEFIGATLRLPMPRL